MPFFKGLGISIGSGIMLLVVGALLPIIGIPIMLLGIMFIFISPMFPFLFIEGECPYCGKKVLLSKSKKAFQCKDCKQRSIISKDRRFVPIP